ncbi:formate dehydrogenase accessory protein FdhE [Oryzomonas japonica]|uniref:Protein FdhE homolog n=1 Tax=Oryzomonas japonica TaxID=2603858 RepID=A0A7J4ZVK1_9BACT|nr:formate dehydrogenase accessory protein FdhE [Oryzomonas japonica]KAB0667145.1 formate dehydrogenase accessory protein FdhE [Oryzomonas japonica]
MSNEDQMLEPGQIEPPAGEIRFLFLAERDLFARRAERFRLLAPGHPLADYLSFLALLADAQQEALDSFPILPLPTLEERALCRDRDMPLLDARLRHRDRAWLEGLGLILRRMAGAEVPAAAREAAAGLLTCAECRLEDLADKILAGDQAAVPPPELPFVAAALQVYWVHMATALGEHAFARLEAGGVCPVCGSAPASGIVHANGSKQGLRYLSCSLCATQWHMVRLKCSSCEATEGIGYYSLEGTNGAVKAESCPDCNAYLKLLYLEKDGRMEATADDLATLALDMLMAEEGKVRGGPNLFLHPGGEVEEA